MIVANIRDCDPEHTTFSGSLSQAMKPQTISFLVFTGAPAAAGQFSVPADFVNWDDSTYTLTSTRPFPGSFQAWIPQSNGCANSSCIPLRSTLISFRRYIGLGQASLGPFYEASAKNDTEGWMLFSPRQTFATITGFWDAEESGDSVISGIPHFTDLLVEACGSVLNGSVDVSEISDFSSSISLYAHKRNRGSYVSDQIVALQALRHGTTIGVLRVVETTLYWRLLMSLSSRLILGSWRRSSSP